MQTAGSTQIIGQTIQHYAQVGSTNDLVRNAAQAGAAEGLVITANEQTKGRGRRGHRWAAPAGSSLLLSVLLRPTWLPVDAAFSLTMLAGVALCEAVEATLPALTARLKWPNDLLLPSVPIANAPLRKAAGILAELVTREARIDYVVLGIGINVQVSPSAVVDGRDLSSSATNLASAAGHTIDRDALRDTLLTRLDARYTALKRGQREALFLDWQARLVTIGQQVTVTTPIGTIAGYAETVDQRGALVLRTPTGETVTVSAGDVSA